VGLSVGLSYGVASFPTDGRLLDFLLKMSDIRLYRSKQQNAGPYPKTRRYPRFDVPGLQLKLPAARARRLEAAEIRDISYGGLAYVTGNGKPPDVAHAEITQRFSSETHRVSIKPVSAVNLPDGRVRVGCAYAA
jgi:hypothetical protein